MELKQVLSHVCVLTCSPKTDPFKMLKKVLCFDIFHVILDDIYVVSKKVYFRSKVNGGKITILKSSGVNTITTPFQAPNANAHAERYVLSCKNECLNHLLIFGLNRLQYVVDCYTSFFNEHRPHQGIDNQIPSEYNMSKRQSGHMPLKIRVRNVTRKDFLGGLLKSYRRAA